MDEYNIDVKKMIEAFSNFYKEYGYEDLNMEFFVNLYLEMTDSLEEYLASIKRNQAIKSMGAFRKYNFAVIDGHKATYNLATILETPWVTRYLKSIKNPGSTEDWDPFWDDPIELYWKILPLENMGFILDRFGYHITLSAKRPLDDVDPDVVSVDIIDFNKTPYTEGSDFFILSNKIYFIGDAARATAANKTLFAYNIYVNYKTPEKLLGSRIGIGYSSAVSYPEYRDFLQMITQVLLKGPTVLNLRDALNSIAGWTGSDVVDMVGASGVREAMWKNPATAILTPFDFLITIPAAVSNTVGVEKTPETGETTLVAKSDRLDLFRSFIDIVKPVDTNYIMALSVLAVEVINLRDFKAGTVTVPMASPSTSVANGKINITSRQSETFSHMTVLSAATFDDGDSFDSDKGYDKPSFAQPSIPGTSGYGDMLSHRHIKYPEFPVSFEAVRDIVTGRVSYSFKDNAVDVQGYKVFRNNDMIRQFDLAPSGGGITLSGIDTLISSMPSGTYRYQAKSFYTIGSTEYLSRPSVTITIIK
jgi:hypothetical protein